MTKFFWQNHGCGDDWTCQRAAACFVLAVLAVLVGAGAQVAWHGIHTPPDLGAICALAREGRFDRAQELTALYLQAFPGDEGKRQIITHENWAGGYATVIFPIDAGASGAAKSIQGFGCDS